MFELFRRVKTVVSSELHAMIDKAEDPIKMVDQFLRDMQADIRDFEKSTAKVMAEQKLLERKCAEAEELVQKREKQALQALESGQEELARRALVDKKNVQQEAETLRSMLDESTRNVEDFKLKLKEMKAEYREMEVKKESLKARAESAKAKAKMNRSLSALNSEGAKAGFDRMEKKVLQFEAEAETSEDLRNEFRGLDDELAQLETESDIDRELEALKAKLNQSSSKEE